jgi:hypothetical protein
VFTSGGNSNQWSSNWTTTNSNSANWILDGGNTKGETIDIGSRDNFSVFIRTNNVNRVKVNDTTGNVAIYDGRSGFVPNERLTVIGNISASGTIYSLNDISLSGTIYTPNGNSNQWNSNFSTTQSNSARWSNWSSVSASYALGSQYVKLSGDTMTGGLSAPALSSQNIYGNGNETVFSDGLTTTGNGSRTLTLNYANGIYSTSTLVVLRNLPTSSAGLPAGALWNSGGFLKIV